MSVRIIQGEEAQKAIRDGTFRSQWARLCEACPWATGFQSPGFVIPWYGAYEERYRILLACEFSPSRDLIGLLPVAIDNASGVATLPGAHQAEYKTWLALPTNGNSFIEQSLRLLAKEGVRSLSLQYVAPETPLDWTGNKREFSWICEVERHPRAIIRVGDTGEVADYLKKKNSLKSTKSKWNRLKRLGNVTFEHVADASQLAPIFDQLITYYEVRQEAIYGKRAFQDDPAKKPFHLALLREPNLLHVSVLKIGDEPVSAAFGLIYGKTYSLAMSMFSPAYAHYSPMMLHFLMLVEHLHKQGFSVLDLTAGADPFKERFASHHDSVRVLSLYTHRQVWMKQKVRRRGITLARRVLRAWGVAPHTARLRLQKFLRTPLRTSAAGIRRISSLAFRSLRRSPILRIYVIKKKDIPAVNSPPLASRDCLADFLAFHPTEFWRTRQSFLSESLTRFEEGWHSYTRVYEDRLRYCGWVIENQKENMFPSIDSEFQFPTGSAVLYSDYCDLNSAGCEWFEESLKQMLHDAASMASTNHIFVVLNADHPFCRKLDARADGQIPLRLRWPASKRRASAEVTVYPRRATDLGEV
jgi:CelD/BcsL family acetyltransferase involved in cellulose biosynthesis